MNRLSSIKETPLPYVALAVLMVVRLAEPVNFNVVFPFINEMVAELHISRSPEDIGYYSGCIESVFAVLQGCTVYHWARLSDRIGRKPVIMMGLAGTAISGSLFGFSTNFAAMLITRSLSGLLNGNVAVVRSAIGDITDATNSTSAFALYGLVWTVGSILGNTIGGFATHPTERYPHLFPPGGLLERFPFLLPCIVTTCITLCGLTFTWVFLKESHPSVLWARSRKGQGRPEAAAYHPVGDAEVDFEIGRDDEDDEDDDARTLVADSPRFASERDACATSIKGDRRDSTVRTVLLKVEKADEEEGSVREFTFRDIMGYPAIRRQLASMWLLSFVGSAWAALSLLVFYTPTSNGGLGLTTAQIGTAMAAMGFGSVLAQTVALNKMRRRFGIDGSYRILNAGYILVFATLPMLRHVVLLCEGPHAGEDTTVGRSFFTWTAVLLWLGLSVFVGMSNSFSMVLLNLCSPHRDCLASLNGVAIALACVARVLGPAVGSALFAISMERHVLGGNLWWIFMVLVCIASAFVGLLVDDRPAQLAPEKDQHKDVESMDMEELNVSVAGVQRGKDRGASPPTAAVNEVLEAVPPVSNISISEIGSLPVVTVGQTSSSGTKIREDVKTA